MSTDSAPGHPEIVRVLAPNPGPMSLDGTNTYVVAGDDAAYVIDPGPDDAGHLERVRAAAEAHGGIAGVLLTHSHSDHTAGVEPLGAPVLWGRVSSANEAEAMAAALAAGDATLVPPSDPAAPAGEAEEAGGTFAFQEAGGTFGISAPNEVGPFKVLATPGHATDHVCFIKGAVCFCGDLILGSGSSIVPPAAGGGSLADYMRSLALIGSLELDLLAPGHGPWITDPEAKIAEYRDHRLDRERRLVAALESGERSRATLLGRVWDDVPEVLQPAAAIAMQAHLEKLEHDGAVDVSELTE